MSARGVATVTGLDSLERRAGRWVRATLIALLLGGFLAGPVWAEDQPPPSSDMMALDVLVFRPMHALVFAVGTAAFVMTVPLPYMFGPSDNAVIHEAYDRLFRVPAKQLFLRPLGDL
jgi:hypothetical protein